MDPLYFLQFACFIFMLINALILYIIGPLALLSILFFNLSFLALGYNYVPTEELLDKEEEESAAYTDEETGNGGSLENSNVRDAEPTDNKENLQSFSQERQAVIKEKLDKWCEELGYKDTTVKMMLDYPDYSNDIMSAECGFSSRSYLYRIFKEKEGCSQTCLESENTS